jgi:hypothetical protein
VVGATANLSDLAQAVYLSRCGLPLDDLATEIVAEPFVPFGVLLWVTKVSYPRTYDSEGVRKNGIRNECHTLNVPQPNTSPVSVSAKLQLSPAAT